MLAVFSVGYDGCVPVCARRFYHTQNGKSALDIAKEKGREEVVALLEQ
jgi:ankyrin repeat protein